MYLSITQEHIDKALAEREEGRALAYCCPIAQALMDAFDTDIAIANGSDLEVGDVTDRSMFDYRVSTRFRFSTSKSMQRFMARFDEGMPVKPTRFRLRPWMLA